VTTAQATSFTDSLEHFFRAVRRARGRAAQSDEGGLSMAQFQLLDPLGGGEQLPVGALAEEAGVAAPSATRMLDGLVRGGFVERSAADHDRRVVLVALTAAGEEALAARRARVAAARRRIQAKLTPAEREQAAALLQRLAEAVEEL
jgi:MarR family transcriptional regulator, organic hydroperoxide resistance regulator